MTKPYPPVGGLRPHLPVLTVNNACLCPPSVGAAPPPPTRLKRPPKQLGP
jgi:hypothetical protein